MEEWVDIVDSQGNPTGKTVLKSEAHKEGWLHPTVHVWCYSKNGEILLQKRSANKKTFPLKWDVSVAGHIGTGEEAIPAALRETREEIGIVIPPAALKKIGLFKTINHHENGIIDAELHHSFMVHLDISTTVFTPQPEEVDSLHWWSIKKLKRELKDPKARLHHVPHDKDYFEAVMRAIQADL